ncbi:hypothetical protein, partial [Blautia sp.]|uniref:hypothetical protein n=1 Tax=Blautia sp. TaxID=1955243 RepID=UPI003AAF10F3
VYSTIFTIFAQFQIFDFYYHKASFSASVAAVRLPCIQKKAKSSVRYQYQSFSLFFVYTAGEQLQRRQKKTLYDNKNQIFGIVRIL